MEDTTLDMAAIFAAKDERYEYVPTPEWGGRVRIGSLSARDVITWLAVNRDPAAGQEAGLHLIIKALVDENGKRIGRPEHLEALGTKDAQVTGRIVKEIMRMNGLERKREPAPKPDPVGDAKNDLSEAQPAASHTT